jgi:hypothetical protein
MSNDPEIRPLGERIQKVFGCTILLIMVCIVIHSFLPGTTPAPQQPTVDMTKEIEGQQMRVEAFNKYTKEIALVERNPDYSSAKSAIVSWVADARRIFQEASAVREDCLAKKIADPPRGHVTAQGLVCESADMRESAATAYLAAVAGWSDPHQKLADDDGDTIRPQILRWSAPVPTQEVGTEPTFESSRREIELTAAEVCDPNVIPDLTRNLDENCEHYAGTSTYPRFMADISKAELYKRKADEAAEVNDWASGFAFLRHSQMIMQDAFTGAVDDAYSRSTNFQP